MITTFANRASNFSLSSNYSEYLDGISSQFEKLSKRVSVNGEDVLEDVYESMLKDVKALTSKEPPQRHTLVKKATGILKLSQFQHHPQKERARAATAPDLEGYDYDDFFFSLENRKNKSGAEFRSHLGKNQSEIISKLALNGGDFSQIWDEFEAASNAGLSTRPPSRNKMSRSTVVQKSTDVRSNGIPSSATKKPLWKYFSNHNVLSSSSTTSLASSVGSNRSNLSNFSRNIKPNGQRPATAQTPQKPKSKSDYTNQVFVVKGQVITFKANEFSQLSNWFGDEDLLKQCRLCGGEFKRELDLSGFTSSEIRIKLHEGYKLVVEAYRPVRNGLPPMRHKSTILLPDHVSVDKLVMCRTSNGRLVIIHIEKFPVGEKKKKKIKK